MPDGNEAELEYVKKERIALVSVLIILAVLIIILTMLNIVAWIGANHNVSVLYAFYADNNIVAVVGNKGNRVESFNVTAYCNGTEIGRQTVTGLQPNVNTILNFSWDTKSLRHDNYSVDVVASIVPNETNTGDNVSSFYVETGSLYRAADCFSFTDVTVDGMILGGNIQIKTLHFDITAVKEEADNVTIFVDGIADPINITRIFNQTSSRL